VQKGNIFVRGCRLAGFAIQGVGRWMAKSNKRPTCFVDQLRTHMNATHHEKGADKQLDIKRFVHAPLS